MYLASFCFLSCTWHHFMSDRGHKSVKWPKFCVVCYYYKMLGTKASMPFNILLNSFTHLVEYYHCTPLYLFRCFTTHLQATSRSLLYLRASTREVTVNRLEQASTRQNLRKLRNSCT